MNEMSSKTLPLPPAAVPVLSVAAVRLATSILDHFGAPLRLLPLLAKRSVSTAVLARHQSWLSPPWSVKPPHMDDTSGPTTVPP
jgi:hypothetical protein